MTQPRSRETRDHEETSAVRSRRPGRIRNGRSSFTSSAYTSVYAHIHIDRQSRARARTALIDRSRGDTTRSSTRMHAFIFSVSLSFSLPPPLSLSLCLLAVPGFLDISPHGMRFVIRYSSLPPSAPVPMFLSLFSFFPFPPPLRSSFPKLTDCAYSRDLVAIDQTPLRV